MTERVWIRVRVLIDKKRVLEIYGCEKLNQISRMWLDSEELRKTVYEYFDGLSQFQGAPPPSDTVEVVGETAGQLFRNLVGRIKASKKKGEK